MELQVNKSGFRMESELNGQNGIMTVLAGQHCFFRGQTMLFGHSSKLISEQNVSSINPECCIGMHLACILVYSQKFS